MTDSDRRNDVATAFAWWRSLNPEGGVQSGRQRAAVARLRRAATPIEVMLEPEALRLMERLPRHPDRVARLIGVLAFVRDTDERPVARAVGRIALDDDRSALLSEGRFRRLLQVPHDEIMEPMRRLVRMAKGQRVNVRDLSYAILHWGDHVKKRWIFDYYGVIGRDAAMPGATASSGWVT